MDINHNDAEPAAAAAAAGAGGPAAAVIDDDRDDAAGAVDASHASVQAKFDKIAAKHAWISTKPEHVALYHNLKKLFRRLSETRQ